MIPISDIFSWCAVIKGWDKGVITMKKGEKAILTCKAAYAYGEQGSPPKVPPGATLNFEVTLSCRDSYSGAFTCSTGPDAHSASQPLHKSSSCFACLMAPASSVHQWSASGVHLEISTRVDMPGRLWIHHEPASEAMPSSEKDSHADGVVAKLMGRLGPV